MLTIFRARQNSERVSRKIERNEDENDDEKKHTQTNSIMSFNIILYFFFRVLSALFFSLLLALGLSVVKDFLKQLPHAVEERNERPLLAMSMHGVNAELKII